MIKKTSILRSNFIGVYSRVWEDIAFLPFNAEDFVEKDFEDILGVETRKILNKQQSPDRNDDGTELQRYHYWQERL
jgi:Translation initiation factor 6 (eIF-6)